MLSTTIRFAASGATTASNRAAVDGQNLLAKGVVVEAGHDGAMNVDQIMDVAELIVERVLDAGSGLIRPRLHGNQLVVAGAPEEQGGVFHQRVEDVGLPDNLAVVVDERCGSPS